MKNDILNIINFEELTKVRSSINGTLNLPPKNTFVSLVPIEFLEKGVKVLIDGRLFIAFIEEKIPLKEEVIALVTSTQPFTLSLNFNTALKKNKGKILTQLLSKLKYQNNSEVLNLLEKVVQEEKPLIKSNFALLNNLTRKINVSGLELSLLINLVWDNNRNNFLSIHNLFEDLFDETFDTVCAKLFTTVKELLFTDISPIIIHQFNTDLIFSEEINNTQAIANKSQILLKIIKSISETYETSRSTLLEDFIKLSSIYILQKSILKEYDYYPDFVIVRYNNKLDIVKYNIKKTYSINDVPVYKLQFRHEELPFELTGIIRNGFLLGNIEMEEDDNTQFSAEIKSFNKSIKDKINIGSSLNINSSKTNVDGYRSGLNKLIS